MCQHTWALAHAGECAQTMCALAPNILMAPLIETITALHHLHPLVEVDFPPFVDDFHLETNLIFDREALMFALTHPPCLSFDGPLGMAYELL